MGNIEESNGGNIKTLGGWGRRQKVQYRGGNIEPLGGRGAGGSVEVITLPPHLSLEQLFKTKWKVYVHWSADGCG